MRRLLCIALLLLPPAAAAQSIERVLIPVAIGRTPGAYGSLWVTDLWASNGGLVVRQFDGHEFCLTLCPPNLMTLSPGESRDVLFFPQPASAPGMVAYVEGPPDEITFNLRVRDLSRQSQTWGTEIPVVRERDFRTGSTRLLNIPSSAAFRSTLRIYTLDPIATAFSLRAFSLSTNATLATIHITADPPQAGSGERYKPAYGQVLDVAAAIPEVTGESSYGLEVSPDTTTGYWVFVSAANNDTQHVTTITPQ